jgi:hypothetical protein
MNSTTVSGFCFRRWFRPLSLAAGVCLAASSVVATNAPLTTALSEITRTTKHIPFKEVIQATTQHRVLDFDTNTPAHLHLRRELQRAAELTLWRARQTGLSAARANEAGNQLEPLVKAALREVGLDARTPATTAGNAQSSGYPDVEIAGAVPCYLELKTFSTATVNTTQRSFYYSPSATPKVTRDALHLLLAFELTKGAAAGGGTFMPVRWKLISLQDLAVDLKFEFNQSNRGLYGLGSASTRLGEGTLPD